MKYETEDTLFVSYWQSRYLSLPVNVDLCNSTVNIWEHQKGLHKFITMRQRKYTSVNHWHARRGLSNTQNLYMNATEGCLNEAICVSYIQIALIQKYVLLRSEKLSSGRFELIFVSAYSYVMKTTYIRRAVSGLLMLWDPLSLCSMSHKTPVFVMVLFHCVLVLLWFMALSAGWCGLFSDIPQLVQLTPGHMNTHKDIERHTAHTIVSWPDPKPISVKWIYRRCQYRYVPNHSKAQKSVDHFCIS